MKRALGLLACLILASGFSCARAETAVGSSRDLRDGFYLLHEVCHEESQVDLLDIIKTTPPDVATYLKRISALAKDSLATLDRFSDHDQSLRDSTDPLPPFERAVRVSIRADKQHLLLFGSKGPVYVRRLLFAQIEGSNYILHLTKVWSERDHDADRAETMRKMSARWLKIRDEGFRMLDHCS